MTDQVTDVIVTTSEISTRMAYMDRHSPVEARASDLVWAIEKMGAHPLLTAAQTKAQVSQALLAEWHLAGEPGGKDNRYEPNSGDDFHERFVSKSLVIPQADEGGDWLVRQLEAWPTRADITKTTNIDFLMKEAAKRLRTLVSRKVAAYVALTVPITSDSLRESVYAAIMALPMSTLTVREDAAELIDKLQNMGNDTRFDIQPSVRSLLLEAANFLQTLPESDDNSYTGLKGDRIND